MTMRHTLITGAAGFLGGALARELLSRGHRVMALVRNEARARERVRGQVLPFALVPEHLNERFMFLAPSINPL